MELDTIGTQIVEMPVFGLEESVISVNYSLLLFSLFYAYTWRDN